MYSSHQLALAPGSIVEELPTLSPRPSELSDPPKSNHSSGDQEDEASPRGHLRPPSTIREQSGDAITQRPLAPTTERWGELTRQVLDQAGEYMRAGLPPLEDEDSFPIQGRPVTWLVNRARTFDSSFRAHRPPTHTAPETLASKTRTWWKRQM